MGFRYACADCTFPMLGHDKVVKLVRLMDFDGIDITLFQDRSHLMPSEVFSNTKAKALEVKQQTEDSELGIADVFLQCDLDFEKLAINHPDPQAREQTWKWYLETVDFAVYAGSKHITILPGVHFESESYEDSFARTLEELSKRINVAKEAGIVLAVEPHIGSIISSAEKTLKLINALPELTLTLDYTHFAKLGMADSVAEPLLAYSSHFHARGARKDMIQCNMNENAIDYKRLIHAMKEYSYSGYISLEYIWTEWEDSNKSDNISETIILRDIMMEEEKNPERN